jgi:sigma-B regulation protein RsbU (phosphoserine phosphatase)
MAEAVQGTLASRVLRSLPGRVLVVDDELPNRVYLRKLLEAREYEVFDAADGEAALEAALRIQPDLILVDVVMQGMDGFELCGKLRAEVRTANIPLIMVTAKSDIEDIETGFERGAMDYIRKPFNPRELMVRVGNAIALKQSNDALEIWNKRVARDLELAGSIQRSLFSNVPRFSRRFEVRVAYRTCMDVGGDAFDVIALPDGKYCIYVADVSGHGVAPAMISSLLKATAGEMIRRHAGEGPAAICNALNRVVRRSIDNPAYFSTFFVALYDPDRLEWRCMNCGHPKPLLVSGRGREDSAKFTQGGGVPIGFPFGDEQPYSATDEVHFKDEGDLFLLLYSDGLTEARHVQTGDECEERMGQIYREVVQDPAVPDKSEALFNALESEGYQLHEDDCTAISIHMLDPEKVVVEQCVPRSIYMVAEIARQSEVAVISKGISSKTAALVRLLVMELGANLVDHSGLGEGDSFWLQVRVDGQVCQMVLIDEGNEWELETALNRKIDETYMGERGRGLAITHAVADRIERYRVDTENLTYCTIIDTGEDGQ